MKTDLLKMIESRELVADVRKTRNDSSFRFRCGTNECQSQYDDQRFVGMLSAEKESYCEQKVKRKHRSVGSILSDKTFFEYL